MFAYSGTGAWASWRRVAQEWDETYSFLDMEYYIKNLRQRGKELFKPTYRTALDRRSRGKAYWETILGMNCMLNNRFVIIPKRNMVTNIGLDENSTHGANPKLIPKKVRRLFNMPTYPQSLPLKHPEYVVLDNDYYKKMCKLTGWGNPFTAFTSKIGYLFKLVIYGEYKRLFRSIKRRLFKRR